MLERTFEFKATKLQENQTVDVFHHRFKNCVGAQRTKETVQPPTNKNSLSVFKEKTKHFIHRDKDVMMSSCYQNIRFESQLLHFQNIFFEIQEVTDSYRENIHISVSN